MIGRSSPKTIPPRVFEQNGTSYVFAAYDPHLSLLTFPPPCGGCSEGLDAFRFLFKKYRVALLSVLIRLLVQYERVTERYLQFFNTHTSCPSPSETWYDRIWCNKV